MMILENQRARIEIDERCGGRLRSIRIGDLELLVGADPDPVAWGCYPMAPWAGRVRNGRFQFEGRDYALPLRMPPHAIHGTVLDRTWTRESSASLRIDLGPDWPWRGQVRQSFERSPGSLRRRMELSSDADSFPASIGWHPWFQRQLHRGGPLSLEHAAASIYVRDAQGLPSGATRAPGLGPFDDCFKDLRHDPILIWPDALRLQLSSTFDHWVVYDEPEHAICVEPLSGPPDALNIAPRIVTPGTPLIGEFCLRWQERP
jgi:aldose 1-epimerase